MCAWECVWVQRGCNWDRYNGFWILRISFLTPAGDWWPSTEKPHPLSFSIPPSLTQQNPHSLRTTPFLPVTSAKRWIAHPTRTIVVIAQRQKSKKLKKTGTKGKEKAAMVLNRHQNGALSLPSLCVCFSPTQRRNPRMHYELVTHFLSALSVWSLIFFSPLPGP